MRAAATLLPLVGLCACDPVQSVTFAPDGITWDHVPLGVEVAPDIAHYEAEIEAGAAVWNRAAGCTLLAVGGGTDVRVSSEGPRFADEDGGAWRVEGPGGQRALVVISGAGTSGLALSIAAHEFGHVLGLAHDPVAWSWMHPIVGEPIGRRAEDADGRALAKRYCR